MPPTETISLSLFGNATILAAFITILAPIAWKVVGYIVDALIFSLSLKTKRMVFHLDTIKNVPEEIKNLKMILIRYGTDQYITTIASDSEKYQGRTRNKITDVETEREGREAKVILKIPVHQRLGTQFKLFVECTGNPQMIKEFLESVEGVESPEISNSANKSRVYFLLARFPIMETVDGLKNNMIFPE